MFFDLKNCLVSTAEIKQWNIRFFLSSKYNNANQFLLGQFFLLSTKPKTLKVSVHQYYKGENVASNGLYYD